MNVAAPRATNGRPAVIAEVRRRGRHSSGVPELGWGELDAKCKTRAEMAPAEVLSLGLLIKDGDGRLATFLGEEDIADGFGALQGLDGVSASDLG